MRSLSSQVLPPSEAFTSTWRERRWLPPPQVTGQALQVDQLPHVQSTRLRITKPMLSSRPRCVTSSQSQSCSFHPLSVIPEGTSKHLPDSDAKWMRPCPSGETLNILLFLGVKAHIHSWITLPSGLSKHRSGFVAHLISPVEWSGGRINRCFFGKSSLHVQICS